MNEILSNIKFVVDNADSVHINQEKITRLVEKFIEKEENYWLANPPFGFADLPIEKKLMVVVIFNASSFCYWGNQYWNVTYKEKTYVRGSQGLIASIFRAHEEGHDILNPEFLAKLSKKDLEHILRANTKLALMDTRAEILNQLGAMLCQKFNGSILEMVEYSRWDAEKLLATIIQTFPLLQDSASYKSKEVLFHKKAQSMVDGISLALESSGLKSLTNISTLTALADYIIPNLLREIGVLEYTPRLSKIIDSQEQLPNDGADEIEIRASVVWAVELMRRELLERGVVTNAININNYLWSIGRETTRPFHRTITSAY